MDAEDDAVVAHVKETEVVLVFLYSEDHLELTIEVFFFFCLNNAWATEYEPVWELEIVTAPFVQILDCITDWFLSYGFFIAY